MLWLCLRETLVVFGTTVRLRVFHEKGGRLQLDQLER